MEINTLPRTHSSSKPCPDKRNNVITEPTNWSHHNDSGVKARMSKYVLCMRKCVGKCDRVCVCVAGDYEGKCDIVCLGGQRERKASLSHPTEITDTGWHKKGYAKTTHARVSARDVAWTFASDSCCCVILFCYNSNHQNTSLIEPFFPLSLQNIAAV